MADFDWITSRLAVGGAVNGPEDVRTLLEQGITHVIDCRTEFDDLVAIAVDPGVSYLSNGVENDGQPKAPDWFRKSIEFAFEALSHPKHKVYAHCAAGGPSTAYAILRAFGFSSAGADALVRSARPQAQIAYKQDADQAVAVLGYA